MNSKSFSDTLTEFSLKRKITVLVLLMSIIVVGVIATMGIPLELFPRGYESPFLRVFVPWQDAPTQEVMEKITLPLEEELSTIKNLDEINSWTSTGNSGVFMKFKQGTDMSVAYREVRDRAERARLRFPDDVERVYIRKDDPSGIPVAVVGMSIDPELSDYYDLVQKEVVLPLMRVDGVANVTTDGLEEKEILIEVDKKLSESNHINIYDIGQKLAGDNFTMASGWVRNSGKKFLLRSVSVYRSLEELENRMLTPTVRVKDVAQVKYEEPEKRYSVRVNGNPAVAVVIFKEGEANTVEVGRRIADALEAMKINPRLQAIEMDVIFNQGQVVEESIGNLIASGRIGGVFAALVLFLFLRRFRLTAIITLSIPLSILISLVFMFFVGETLNLLTILGLVICVGLLVDNSVVVAENIHRYYRDGLSSREACVKGASEIALAITMATLTTVIVFLPAALVDGQGQFFLIRLAMPISVSLIASLFVALVFIPLSVYLTLPTRFQRRQDSAFQRWHERLNSALRFFYDQVFERMNHGYSRALGFFLQHRLDLVLVLAAVFAVTQGVAFKKIKFVENQEEDQSGFRIHVEMDNTYNRDDIAEYFQEAEKVMETKKEQHGLRGYLAVHFSRGGRIEGWLSDSNEGNLSTAKEIAEDVLKDLPKKPGVKIRYGQENENKDDSGREVFVFTLQGDDAALLDEVAEELEPMIEQFAGVLGIRKGNDDAPSELAMVVNREKANASNVNPELVAGVVGYALRGQSLPRYHHEGREVPVRVRFREEDRGSLHDLNSFQVPTQNGAFLSLASLTDVKMLDTPRGIFRNDKKISRTITVELKPEEAKQTKEMLEAFKESIDLPEGMAFGKGWQPSTDEDLANMMFAGVLSVVFIYLLMGFLFESFILPLSIILTIPLAGIGMAWAHYITGKDIDFLGVVGCILLIGVVVNNGIVLIDYVNRLRKDGLERREAILKAADRRFRPIIMTALTTIIGMIPLTISKPLSMGLSYKSFGITLIGGMSAATILTLLVVPVFYTLFDDARQQASDCLRRALHGSKETEPLKTQATLD